MEVLFDNSLVTMSGPQFLFLYGFVIVLALAIISVFKSRLDKSDKLNLPPILAQIDPFEIAYLRGGTNEIARVAIFSLLQKGLIETKTEGKTAEILRTNGQSSLSGLNFIEKITLDWIGNRREAHEVFNSSFGLVRQLESYGRNYQSRLEKAQMLVDDNTRQGLRVMKWFAILLVLGLGAYKLFVALANGNSNVLFLIVFAVIGLILIKILSRPFRLTKLGKAYLERLQLAFEGLRNQTLNASPKATQTTVSSQPVFAGIDPLLLSVGVFGSAALAGTVFDSYNQAFARQQQNSYDGCSSGCGSSCAGSEGGGSSCSGGSSCGGGCGGCGGCGG